MWSWSLLRFVKANELLFGWIFFKSSYNNPFIKHNKIAENRVVIFFGYLQHFHQMPLLLEDLAWLFLDYCVFWTKQDHSEKVWFKYNIDSWGVTVPWSLILQKSISQRQEPYFLQALDLEISKITWNLV